jgi:hypothetical protein
MLVKALASDRMGYVAQLVLVIVKEEDEGADHFARILSFLLRLATVAPTAISMGRGTRGPAFSRCA